MGLDAKDIAKIIKGIIPEDSKIVKDIELKI